MIYEIALRKSGIGEWAIASADYGHRRRLLRAGRERPRRNRASNHFDEVAPSHAARSGAQDHVNPIQSAAAAPSPERTDHSHLGQLRVLALDPGRLHACMNGGRPAALKDGTWLYKSKRLTASSGLSMIKRAQEQSSFSREQAAG
jgi:hypothetical protein